MPRRRSQTTTQTPDLSYIIEPLRHLAVPIDQLTPDPENPRQHGQVNMEAISASLRQFGQRLPIVVQKTGMIVRAGNGRLQAAKDLGWQYLAAIVTDEADAVAKAFGVAENRTGELATWNKAELARILDSIQDEQADLLAGVGFDMREMEDLITRYLGSADETILTDPRLPQASPLSNTAAPAPLTNPMADFKYLHLTLSSQTHENLTQCVRYFGARYGLTNTPDIIVGALMEFKESLADE